MPNTLAHLGVGGVVTRAVIRDADPRWIFLACVIPDAPWIFQRAVQTLPIAVDPYELRLYVIAQASLLVSLALCAAFASLALRPARVFGILAFGSLLHLVVDALQTKWANGVHLFAPLSWELWNQELFWPEHAATYMLTAFGAVYALLARLRIGGRVPLLRLTARRVLYAYAFGATYVLLPLIMLSGPYQADNHSVRTLHEHGERAGRAVAFDRNSLVRDAHGGVLLRTFAGESLRLEGEVPPEAGVVSIRGTFRDARTVIVHESHDHSGWPRDLASYAGLLILLLIWTVPPGTPGRKRRAGTPAPSSEPPGREPVDRAI